MHEYTTDYCWTVLERYTIVSGDGKAVANTNMGNEWVQELGKIETYEEVGMLRKRQETNDEGEGEAQQVGQQET